MAVLPQTGCLVLVLLPLALPTRSSVSTHSHFRFLGERNRTLPHFYGYFQGFYRRYRLAWRCMTMTMLALAIFEPKCIYSTLAPLIFCYFLLFFGTWFSIGFPAFSVSLVLENPRVQRVQCFQSVREREYFGRVETNQPAVCVFLLLPRRWRNVLKSYQFVALKFGPSSLTSLSLSLVLSNSHLFGSGPDISHPLYLYLVHELRLVFVWECCGACSSVRIFYGLVLGNFPREILISVFFAPFDSNMCCAYVVDFFFRLPFLPFFSLPLLCITLD